jgi:hypothetical protein
MADSRSDADLQELLARPREALDIEVKNWLDMKDANHRADLAKAIIAIANHGGGFVVMGLDEDGAGQFTVASERPQDLSLFSQDVIQDVVQKYLEPVIQCRVDHVVHPDGHGSFPVIVVPGEHRTPIKARAGSPDGKLVVNRVYIRRPGPRSEEPKTSAEWDQLFERCIRARRDELLDGIRDLLAGASPRPAAVVPTLRDRLAAFMAKGEQNWAQRVATLPPNAPPRFPHGFYDAGFALDGILPERGLGALASVLQNSLRNHSGWPPFAYLHSEPFRPRPIGGAIEAWFGPAKDRQFDDAAHSDFWRISPDGYFFTRRGYNEDRGYRDVPLGTSFDITTSSLRISETIMQVYYVLRELGAQNETVLMSFRWTGLSGRRLVSIGNPNRMLSSDNYKADQKELSISKEIAHNAIPDAIPDLTWEILAPVYQLFDFWPLPKRLVEEEVRALLRHTFAR